MAKDKTLITHPNYGSRRLEGVYTEISLNQENVDNIPTDVDIILDFGLGKKRLYHHLGRAQDETHEPSVPLGLTSRRFTVSNYNASMYGAPARLLALLNDSSNYSGKSMHNPGSGFTAGALHDTTANNIVYTDSLYPFDTGIPGYSSVFSGVPYQTGLGYTPSAGTRPLDDFSVSLVTGSQAGATDANTTRFRTPNKGMILDYHLFGRQQGGAVVRGLFTPTVVSSDGTAAFDGMATPLLDATTNAKKQALGDLASRMIITPDEYVMRNDQAFADLFERMHDIQIVDWDYHMKKGKRSSWASRVSDTSLHIMGELSHLGMSLRLGQPVQNCHSAAYLAPSSKPVTVKTTESGTVVEKPAMFFGHAFASTAASGTEDEDADALLEETAEFDTDNVKKLNPMLEVTASINPVVATTWTNWADTSVTANLTVGLTSVNASINPFFIEIPDVRYRVVEGVLDSDTENRGYFASLPELALLLARGIYEISDGTQFDREQQWADFVAGMNFVFAHCHSDQAAAYATRMRTVRTSFVDFKEGELVDVYSEGARVSDVSLRHAWNLGHSLTLPLQDGVVASTSHATANLARFYNNGFVNTNVVDLWKNEIDQLRKKEYAVSADYASGLQSVGDAKYTTFHRTTYDGVEHSIDVTLMPHAFGHWANVPASWTIGGTTYVLNLDGPSTGINGVANYTRAIHADMILDGTNWDLNVIFESELVLERAFGRQSTDSVTNQNAGCLSFVFPGIIDSGTNIVPLAWKHLTEAFTQTTLAKVANNFNGINFGSDIHGFTEATPSVLRTTSATSDFAFLTEANTSFHVTGNTPRWHSRFDRLVNFINAAREYVPYKTDPVDLRTTSVNLVAVASFNTGEPALQQMGDAIFTLAFCGRNSGWSIDTRTVDRKLHDESIHRWGHLGAEGDYAAWFMPKNLDASKLLTAFAATHLVNWKLGLIGANYRTRDNALHYVIDFEGSRTIYRERQHKNGNLIEKRITAPGAAFDFHAETEHVTDHTLHPTASANSGLSANQFRCQPGSGFIRRLFTLFDPDNLPSTANSVCAMFGLSSTAGPAGSRIAGLDGFVYDVPSATIRTLHNQHTGGTHASDGSTGDKADYWATNLASMPAADRVYGDMSTAIPTNRINIDFIKVMVERNRGIDNLYFTEADIRIAFVDQDIFSRSHAILSCLNYVNDRTMILGPTPHAIVFDNAGSVVFEARDVLDYTGAGQAAVASSGDNTPSNDDTPDSPPVASEDSDD